MATLLRLPVLARTTPLAVPLIPPKTLLPGDRVPVNPATGSPVMTARTRGSRAATASTATSVAGAIPSSGDSPLSSTKLIGVVTPSRRISAITAPAAPLNVAGRPVAIATCRARFSAMTLLLSCSICSTIEASVGEVTWAIAGAPAGAVAGCGLLTVMPSPPSKVAKACAVTPAGSIVRGS